MAGKVVETVSLKLDLQGFAQLQGLGNKFKKLENPIKLAGTGVTKLKNEIMGLGKVTPNTISHLNAQADALTRVRQTVEIGTQEFKELTTEINRVQGAITKANASMNKASFGRKDMFQGLSSVAGATAFGGPLPGVTGLIGGGISKLAGQGFAAGTIPGVAAGFALKPAVEGISGATTYAADIEKSKIALEGATKVEGDPAASIEAYKNALATAARVTKQFNVPQEIAIKGMTRLSAAVIGAGGNVHNASLAFTSVIAAIKGTAGSSEDAKAAITALVQIYSKGKVSAEELSGQLGERFPAAVTKFAKANDMEAASLQKMLKDGTVGLDMLEKFVISLGKEYIPIAEKIAKSSEEAGARARVAFNELRISVGKQLIPIGEQFQEIGIQILTTMLPAVVTISKAMIPVFKAIAGIIKFVVDNFHALASIMAVAGGVAAGVALKVTGLGAALAAMNLAVVVKQIGAMVLALKAMTFAQIKANIAAFANPYVALAAGLTAATIAAYRFATANDRLKAKLASGDATEEDVNKIFKRRLEIQKKIKQIEDSKEFKAGRQGAIDSIARLKKEYAELTEAIEDFRKAVEDGASMEELMEKALKMSSMSGGDGTENPLAKFAKEGFDYAKQIETAVVGAFGKMENAIVKFAQTGKLEFKDLVSSILADMLKIAIRATITAPLMKAMGFAIPGLADGGVIAGNNIVPYRKGGVVNSPTMFQYGGSKLGIMGEAGPEAILPLKRGSSGKLGVEMHGGRGGGGTTNVNYTGPTLNFNGDQYVPRSAVNSIVQAAATKGAALGETATMRSLQNNRSARGRLGM
jgi:lambda family phage tail tape measure protein